VKQQLIHKRSSQTTTAKQKHMHETSLQTTTVKQN
jgi:hypothetical protein